MAQLRQDYPKFVDRNAEVIAVGPESAKEFTDWWHEHQMPFIGIPDPKHDVGKLYNQQFKLLRGGRLPALSVIDREGKIRLMHYADLPSDIPSNEDVLALLDKVNAEVESTRREAIPEAQSVERSVKS
jgi:peroxiredoxin